MTLRLSLVADAALRERATAAGVSPGAYVAADLERRLNPGATQHASNKRTSEVAAVHPSGGGCAHKVTELLSGGLARCKGCGAVRGVDRIWRG